MHSKTVTIGMATFVALLFLADKSQATISREKTVPAAKVRIDAEQSSSNVSWKSVPTIGLEVPVIRVFRVPTGNAIDIARQLQAAYPNSPHIHFEAIGDEAILVVAPADDWPYLARMFG